MWSQVASRRAFFIDAARHLSLIETVHLGKDVGIALFVFFAYRKSDKNGWAMIEMGGEWERQAPRPHRWFFAGDWKPPQKMKQHYASSNWSWMIFSRRFFLTWQTKWGQPPTVTRYSQFDGSDWFNKSRGPVPMHLLLHPRSGGSRKAMWCQMLQETGRWTLRLFHSELQMVINPIGIWTPSFKISVNRGMAIFWQQDFWLLKPWIL